MLDMNTERSRKFKKFAIVLACMLLMMTGGLPWYWGNISTYTLSYVVTRLGSTSGVEAPWVLSLYTVFEMVSLMAFGVILTRYIDRRWLVLIGIVITELSLCLTYFAVQRSYFALVSTMGISLGIGTGLLYANGIHMIVEIADKDMGLLTSLFQSSFTAGALIANKALSSFVNPTNESPELKLGSTEYFTQDSVLDKVPVMYIAFGGCSLLLHTIGFMLLQISPSMRISKIKNIEKIVKPKKTKTTKTSKSKKSEQKAAVVKKIEKIVADEKRIDAEIPKEVTKIKENGEKSMNNYESVNQDGTESKDEINYDYSPTEMLKTSSFYILWFSFFIGDIAFFLLTNYYKSYGQIFIHDDYFLTDLGTAVIFVSMLARLMWGVLIDRLGLKVCLTAISSSVVVLNFLYYFTPMINRYLYLLVSLLYGGVTGAMYSVFLAATAMLFGRKHASANFSLMLTAPVVFNLMAPLTLDLLLTYCGWFVTFTGASVLGILSLVLILVFFRRI